MNNTKRLHELRIKYGELSDHFREQVLLGMALNEMMVLKKEMALVESEIEACEKESMNESEQ
jgi:hypothetical protein